jgi:DNA-binding NarL/FixJ family response regulator
MSLKKERYTNKKILLIVDDEQMIHDLLEEHLQRMKTQFEIHHALTGEEAIGKYAMLLRENKRLHLVVMDLNLIGGNDMNEIGAHMDGKTDKIDGVETTRRIVEMDPKARIWGYTAWFDTKWSDDLKQFAEKVIERTVPFHDFAKMIDAFFQRGK